MVFKGVMINNNKTSRLGKGLDALFTSTPNFQQEGQRIVEIDLSRVIPNPDQPRSFFAQDALRELADSIREHGVLQPIIVQKKGSQYQIIVGERRYQASKLAGMEVVPVIIRDITKQQNLELAILENVQRKQLTAMEEARAYARLHSEFNLEYQEIAKKLGKKPSTISNKIRLLQLATFIQDKLQNKQISEGHARALLMIDDVKEQERVLQIILTKNLSVRQTEDLISNNKELSKKKKKKIGSSLSMWHEKEKDLQEILGQPVVIKDRQGKGKIEISYTDSEEREQLFKFFQQHFK